MVEFKEVAFGEREMLASIKSVHLDKVDEKCPVTGRNPRSQQVHFTLNVYEPEGWKPQNWWLYDSLAIGTSWYEIIRQLKKLKIITDDEVLKAGTNFDLAKKIVENSKGKKFRFAERRIGRASNPNWFPEGLEEK